MLLLILHGTTAGAVLTRSPWSTTQRFAFCPPSQAAALPLALPPFKPPPEPPASPLAPSPGGATPERRRLARLLEASEAAQRAKAQSTLAKAAQQSLMDHLAVRCRLAAACSGWLLFSGTKCFDFRM